MKILNKKQVAELLNCGIDNIIRYTTYRCKTPIPHYKRVGGLYYRNGDWHEVPENFGRFRLIFIKSEVLEWARTK